MARGRSAKLRRRRCTLRPKDILPRSLFASVDLVHERALVSEAPVPILPGIDGRLGAYAACRPRRRKLPSSCEAPVARFLDLAPANPWPRISEHEALGWAETGFFNG
jgi:hypothetical protein